MFSVPLVLFGDASLLGTVLPPAVLTVPPREGRGPLITVFLLPPLPKPPFQFPLSFLPSQ
jgi:hypothetical protein